MSISASDIQVVDFFSGCGGTSFGLRESGMSIVAGIDCDQDAADSYTMNFPEATVFSRDIQDIAPAEIESLLDRSKVTLFAGCAPCQPFSIQRNTDSSTDARRHLLLVFLRFIEKIRPELILVENVPGLQKTSAKDGPFGRFLEGLDNLGYSVDYSVLRAVDYGVPQVRRRLVLVASRVSAVRLPMPTHGQGKKPVATVQDWISGLPRLEAGAVDSFDPDHAAAALSELNLRRIQATPMGGNRLDWPEDLRLDCHQGHSGHTDVYGRMSWDKPSPGLTTRCVSYSNGRFGHPEQDRAISVREAALLQTFPLTLKLSGTLTSKARQIGNAVPPLMAERIGEALIRSLSDGARIR